MSGRVIRTMLGATAIAAAMLLAPAAADANRYLYSANAASGDVSGFTVGSNGTLAPIFNSPYAAGLDPESVTMTPDASALFVSNQAADSISGYPVNSVNGTLGAEVTTPTGDTPRGLAIDPAGRYLFAANTNDDAVQVFEIGENPGELTEVASSPQATVADPWAIAVSPDGGYLYVAGTTAGELAAYAINGDGSLTELLGSPYPLSGQPSALTITPDGHYLYAAKTAVGTIAGFSREPDGTLTEIAGSPFAGGGAMFGLAASPQGDRVYATSGIQNAILGYGIGADGALAPLSGSPYDDVGDYPVNVALTPDGKRVYASDYDLDSVYAYSANASGNLAQLGAGVMTGGDAAGSPNGLVLAPDQGPTAAFNVSSSPTSNKVTLLANGSTDPDGLIGTYLWDFGDGETATTTGPSVSHNYAKGSYTATLTVIDDEGCSAFTLFTGQTVSCNGSGGLASTSRSFQVSSGGGGFTAKLKVPSKQKLKRNKKKMIVRGKAKPSDPAGYLASGKVKAGKKTYKLKSVERDSVAAGKLSKFKLKAPNRLGKKILKYLRKHKKATAKVKVKFVSAGGKRLTKKAQTKLVLKKK